MRKLKKHNLEFEKTYKYISYQLECGNILSEEILRLVDFSSGQFFTLLPDDADVEKCYEFKSGGILPQPPTEWYFTGERMASYSLMPNIQEEITEYILQKSVEDGLISIFEDALSLKKDKPLPLFKENHILYYFKENVYYLIKKTNINKELIAECLNKSNSIWHFLCVLTKCSCDAIVDNELTLKDIKDICSNLKAMLIGAYDGEGYVFWEKNNYAVC